MCGSGVVVGLRVVVFVRGVGAGGCGHRRGPPGLGGGLQARGGRCATLRSTVTVVGGEWWGWWWVV